jgi:hypothetical protein
LTWGSKLQTQIALSTMEAVLQFTTIEHFTRNYYKQL